MQANNLKLIKDLDNYRYVYYWACPEQGRISPDFPTLLHAGEWIADIKSSSYTGKERRQTIQDRRKRGLRARSPGQELLFSRREKEGRRITDRIPSVDMDLTPEKLNDMKGDLLN